MKKPLVAAFLIVAAIPLLIGVAALPPHGDPSAPAHNRIAVRYLERGEEEAAAANIVTDVILNYRGLDTSGEVTVIFTGLVATLAVLLTAPPLFMRENGGGATGAPAATAATSPASASASPAPTPVSPVVAFVIRLIAPFTAMFAGYVILHGAASPGGGFQGGAILGGLFIVITVIVGRERTLPLLPRRATPWMQGVAVMTFVAVGSVGAAFTGYFLGFPAMTARTVAELMIEVLEIGIGLGGAAIFATIFLQMEAE